MPRKINPLPFEESNMQPAESWSLPDWLVGSQPGMLERSRNQTPTNYNVQDAISALGLDAAPAPMASIGNPSQIEIPRAPASEPAPINPALKQALLKKMAPPSAPPPPMGQNVSDEQKAQSEYEAGKVNPWLAFASGVGQTLQGKSPDLSWQDAQNKLVYDKTLGKLRLDKKDAESKRQHDEEMAFKREQLKIQDAQRRDMAKLNAGYREDARNAKQAEVERKNLPEERVKTLPGTDKARYDNALMAIKALDEMAAALDKGSNTFSLVGDNPYTAAERRATEAYGRMQSGGAINKEEEKRFSETLPGVKDPADVQRQKILTQRAEMISRLKTLGFTPDQVGVAPGIDFKYGASTDADAQAAARQKRIAELRAKRGQ